MAARSTQAFAIQYICCLASARARETLPQASLIQLPASSARESSTAQKHPKTGKKIEAREVLRLDGGTANNNYPLRGGKFNNFEVSRKGTQGFASGLLELFFVWC